MGNICNPLCSLIINALIAPYYTTILGNKSMAELQIHQIWGRYSESKGIEDKFLKLGETSPQMESSQELQPYICTRNQFQAACVFHVLADTYHTWHLQSVGYGERFK